MNKILSVMITGFLTGITCAIGIKVGEDILDKVEETSKKIKSKINQK